MKERFTFLLICLMLLCCCLFSQSQDSIELKIGQMIMFGFSGTSADTNSTFYKAIKEGKIGGVTFYESNLTQSNTAENLRLMINTLQSAAPITLFTAITQEGGVVNRLKTKYGFPPMPSAEYLGKINNLDSTKYYADNIAYTLSRVGINLNFAPVVDIYMPANPVLGSRERTFSAKTDVIIKHARQVIISHNYFNVNTALKHFPGHGSSTTDSHLGLTDVSKTWKPEELKPYQELIKNGLARSIMTAHIVNEQLDKSKHPATLSNKIITDLLRKQLKFTGVVFSDDMNMKAISTEYKLKESIQNTINAGVDVLLFSGNISGVERNYPSDIINIILELVNEGKISKERIDESYRRIIKMKADRKSL